MDFGLRTIWAGVHHRNSVSREEQSPVYHGLHLQFFKPWDVNKSAPR